MLNLIAKNKKLITAKTISTTLAVAAAVLLPQLFHFLGFVSGLGSSLGAALLPMHLPVLLFGIMAGPFVGIMAGLISPLLSFGISGMPAVAILPYMTIELAFYGLVGGLLYKSKLPVIIKLLIAQVAGRLARLVAVAVGLYVFRSKGLSVQSVFDAVTVGLFGIVLQWAIIPLVSYRLKESRLFND